MFDVGFLEIVLISVISLVVLGPERLPGAIRTVTLWIGRLRRSFNNIKQDIEREIGADEIRRQLRNEAIMEKFKQTKAQVNETINSVKKETDELRKTADLESQMASFTGNPAASGSGAKTTAPVAAAPAPEATANPASAAARPEAATTPSPAADETTP